MARFSICAAILLVVVCTAAPVAAAPVSRCAECHFANFFDVPQSAHLGEWQRSAHARHDVGCERCHGGALGAFRRSRHAALVEQGDLRSPSCSTCHGAMSTRVPSLAAFEAQCARCHGAQTSGADYPLAARTGPVRPRR